MTTPAEPISSPDQTASSAQRTAPSDAARPTVSFAPAPAPRSERGAWLLACSIAVLGLAVLVAVLTGVVGRTSVVAPPAMLVSAATPTPSPPGSAAAVAASASAHARAAIVARPTPQQQRLDAGSFLSATSTQTHISRRWMEGFYPIYSAAQSTFAVNWLLLASIHRQESAFSTAPGIYQGLNFAHCCGGPMQFNVTNGGAGVPSTWDLVSDSYKYARRPASYDHMTAVHPSIYDDFDAIMAAAHLLSADGAEYALNGSAWDAAYDYYGHDATGVTYADQVLARAIGWSQHGFCINCGVEQAMVEAVHAAYGAPVLAALEAEAPAEAVAAKRATRPGATRRHSS
jgi:hypothetical protein